jgi:flagellum-specific peptidoglycan hydrolase FlgJ
MNPSLFITQIAPPAIQACQGTNLFPSLMIAQACLESNYGKSKLSALHHNYFGIKASTGWKGKTVTYQTQEFVNNKSVTVKQPFRSYPSLLAGFADRVRFLQVNKRYTLHGVFKSTSPEEQARCFLKAGYATDPSYPQKLISIINKYDLKKHDPPCKTPLSTSTTISTTNPM